MEGHWDAADGLRLFRRTWLGEPVSRVLVLVHGYAEHSGRYDEFGAWLAERGWAVHALDLRGHGRSEGRRCHVRSFDEYLDDVARFVDLAREEHPAVPLAIFGHSMGGLITLTYLVERRPALRAAATSGAALAVGDVGAARILAARALRRVWPTLALGSGLDLEGLSRDPEVVRRYEADPLVERRMTASLGACLLETARRTVERGAEVEPPLLMLHGEADPLCRVEGSRRFSAAVASRGSELRTYPELRHEILNEPERVQVYQDLRGWLEETMD